MKENSLLNKKYDRNKFTLANQSIWDKLTQIKGNKFLNYRKLLKKAENGELLTDFPIEILIKSTLNCNHKCPRCPHGVGIFPNGEKYNMSFDTLKKVLDEGADKGLQSVVFTGGEPTLNPNFIQFIEYASLKNFPDISVITNGSLLSDKIIDCLLNNEVTRINISFDSITNKIYKKVRGIDDYYKVLANIDKFLKKRKLKNTKLPLLSVSFVLSEDNAHELDKFIEIWQEKADGGIKIYPYKNFYSVVDNAFYNTYGSGRKKVEELQSDDLPITLSHNLEIMEEYNIKCTIPWYRCNVGVNGELQACTTIGFCDHPLMTMGNIHEITFEEAWKSENWSNLRKITLKKDYEKHPICKICQKSI